MLNEEMIKLRNLENLDVKEKIILESNIQKIGLNNLILSKNFENQVINISYNKIQVLIDEENSIKGNF